MFIQTEYLIHRISKTQVDKRFHQYQKHVGRRQMMNENNQQRF